jgi:SAM-dependent methyltransferase
MGILQNDNTEKTSLPSIPLSRQYDTIATSLTYILSLRFRAFLYWLYYIDDILQSLQRKYKTNKIAGSIVDIWCGTWAKTKHLLEHFRGDHTTPFFAVDISARMLSHAKNWLSSYANVEYIQWNMISWPDIHLLSDKNIQWVFLNQVLHHYSREEIYVFLQKLY